MQQLAIILDDSLARALNMASHETKTQPEALVIDALRRRLATLWVKDVQGEFGNAARKAGFESEDDLLREIS